MIIIYIPKSFEILNGILNNNLLFHKISIVIYYNRIVYTEIKKKHNEIFKFMDFTLPQL